MSRRSRVRAPPGPMYLHFLPMKELTLSVSALTLLSHSPIREVTLHLPEMKQRLRYGCAVSSKTMFIDLSIFLLLSVSHNYSFSCILLNLLFLLPAHITIIGRYLLLLLWQPLSSFWTFGVMVMMRELYSFNCCFFYLFFLFFYGLDQSVHGYWFSSFGDFVGEGRIGCIIYTSANHIIYLL